MKKLIFVISPFLVAILVFSIIILFVSRNKDRGALQVTSAPLSKVYLNGKLVGQTPLCECDLNSMIEVGDYTLRVVSNGGNFDPFEQKITIFPKVLTVVDRTFAPQALAEASIISLNPLIDKNQSSVSVISFPTNAQVFFDNALQGQTPLLINNVTQSDHELKLTKEGYKEKIVRIKSVLGYKLEAIIFLGIDPQIATTSANPVSSASAVLSPAKVIILETPTGFLRVRKTASVAAAVVGEVKPGEIYDLINELSGWYEIKLNDKTNGWISSQYAQKQG
jgi:hypothetical protein